MSSVHHGSAWGSGKLILFGEHSVVYGQPAVAAALPRGLKVTLTPYESPEHPTIIYDTSLRHTLSGVSLGEAESTALNVALTQAVSWARTQGLTLSRSYRLSVEGSLPFKVGLGSSAALAVATLRALADSEGHKSWSEQALFSGAMEMERVFHVNPSGLDHQVSIAGGALCYQRKGTTAHFTPLRVLSPLTLVLTWIPRHGSTADAVRGVAERRAQAPEQFERIFIEMGELARKGARALEHGQIERLGDLLNQNHGYLHRLGVTTAQLNELCDHLRASGAQGAKMSGAGHGGVCLGLFSSLEVAHAAAATLGTPYWITTLEST